MKTTFATLLLTIFIFSNSYAQVQWSAYIMVEDAIGTKDTVWIGFHPDGTDEVDTGIGEVNIVQTSRNSVLDIRFSDEWITRDTNSSSAATFHLKEQYVGDFCALTHDALFFDIKAKHYPITVKWQGPMFADSCVESSYFSNQLYKSLPRDDVFRIDVEQTNPEFTLFEPQYNETDSVHWYVAGTDTLVTMSLVFKKTVRVPPTYNPASYKPGWNLIFYDEFNTGVLDTVIWDLGDHNDDGWINCNTPSTKSRGFVMNESLPYVGPATGTTGALILPLNDTDYESCDYSVGEVKTFTWNSEDLEYWLYRMTYLNRSSYTEVRARFPEKKGQSGALWLYGSGGGVPYNEIDFVETHGSISNEFSATIHFQVTPGAPEHLRYPKGEVIKLKKAGGGKMFTSDWMTYGTTFDSDKIDFFYNGKLGHSIDLDDKIRIKYKDGGHHGRHKPIGMHLKKAIRMNSGPSVVGPDKDAWINASDLPQKVEIDWIRVYQKVGTQALIKLDVPNSVCTLNEWGDSAGYVFYVNYYPYVTYNWTSSGLINHQIVNPDNHRIWGVIDPLITSNTFQTVTVTATFPSGYVENRTFDIYVNDVEPSDPSSVVGTYIMLGTCMQTVMTEIDDEGSTVYWSKNSGPYVKGEYRFSGGKHYSVCPLPSPAFSTQTYDVKAVNGCGESAVKTFTHTFSWDDPYGCVGLRIEGESEETNLNTNTIASNFEVYDIMGRLLLKGTDVSKAYQKVRYAGFASQMVIVQYKDDKGVCVDTKKIYIPH